MHVETLANPAFRAGLHQRLRRRNRIIDVLRVLVPLLGLMLFGFLIAEIVIASMANSYGLSGIHLDRNRLLIDVPRYEGVTENGLRYKVAAETASALLSRADIIELDNVTLEIVRPDGVTFSATTSRAIYDLIGQTVEVPGVAEVTDSRKTGARLFDSFVDWRAQTITARGGARITFADGTRLMAQTLVMYGADDRWDMMGVTLDTPGSKEAQ